MNPSHPRLEMLVPIADVLAQTMGPNCEIAIHDLAHPQHSIFYIANGGVTNRHIGDSLSPFFTDLVQLAAQNHDRLTNYYTEENGHALRCTKLLIRDEDDSIIGCFCINIIIDEYLNMKRVIDHMCDTRPLESFQPAKPENDTASDSVSQLMERIVSSTYDEIRKGRAHLSKTERLKMIRFLDEKGVFRIKGSVEMVAATLGVSKFTVYSDIDKLKDGSPE